MEGGRLFGGPAAAFSFPNFFGGPPDAAAGILRTQQFAVDGLAGRQQPQREEVEQPRQSLGDTADGKHQANTSINIFRSFIRRVPSTGDLDATGVTSEKCYQLWLNSRKSKPSCPEKAFQRALSGHITGVDGRVPFDQEEEEAILRAVRRKARWECFKHCDIKFGESGFRTKGFHEKAYAGEIEKTQPKKRAKRAIEKIRSISKSLEAATQARHDLDEEDDDDEGEEDSSSNESSVTSPSSSSSSSHPNKSRSTGRKTKSAVGNGKYMPPPPSRYPLRSVVEPALERERSGSSSSSSTEGAVFYPYSFYGSSASALSMNIPVGVGAPISAAASSLFGMLVNMFLSLGALGLPYIKVVLVFHRTIQYSRGWFTSPRLDQAEQLMARLNAKYPTDYIILCDFTQDPLNRYLVLNEMARRMFGKITQKDGGCKGVRCPPREIWSVLKAYSEAAMLPSGQEIRTVVTLYVRSEERLCEVFLSMDDETHTVVERGRLLDGPLKRGPQRDLRATRSTESDQTSAPGSRLKLARDIPSTS
jgi:hypothetical protein